MLDGWRVVRRSWRPFYEGMFYLSIANLAWAVLAFFIVPIPLATAMLFYLANLVARDEVITWRRVWEGVRPHLRTIYLLGAINGLIYLTLWYDVGFYAQAPGTWGVMVRAVPIALLTFWTPIQFNLLPVLFENEDQRLWPVLRDAALLALLHPGFYLVIYLWLLIPLAISTVLVFPWAIVTLGYVAVVINTALLERRGFFRETDRRQAELERKRRLHGDTEQS